MSIMFLDDVRARPVARPAGAWLGIGLYAIAAIVFVVVAPLASSYLMGGLAPMLVLTVYLLPLVPLLLLVAIGAVAIGSVAPALKASTARHARATF